jgi:hypothetical protein
MLEVCILVCRFRLWRQVYELKGALSAELLSNVIDSPSFCYTFGFGFVCRHHLSILKSIELVGPGHKAKFVDDLL